MGSFKVQLKVGNPRNGISETVDALVNTGATFSILPASMLLRLGIEPDEPRPFRTASGEIVEYMTGDAIFRVNGHRSPGRVVFGPENHYVMGSTTLESLLLKADPVHQRLIPTEGLLMSPQLIQEPEI